MTSIILSEANSLFEPPWSASREETSFRRCLASTVLPCLLGGLIVININLPPLTRSQQEVLPAALAEIILAPADLPEPAPKKEPVPEKIKPVIKESAEKELVKKEPVKKEPVKKEPVKREPVESKTVPPQPLVTAKVEPAVKPVPAQTVQQAREKANNAGILAFKDDLKALREAVDTQSLSNTDSVQRGGGTAATLDRSLLTSKKAGRSASVNVSELSREIGGVALSGRETTVVNYEAEVETVGAGHSATGQKVISTSRSVEAVRRVFDANKGAIFAIYNRALRKNPDLSGKLVLELVIEPDGKVSALSVAESELADPMLVQKIQARISLFDFGRQNVSVTRINYPIHFLPGSV